MARKTQRRRIMVPGARSGMDTLRTQVLTREGYAVDPNRPDEAKYGVAAKMGIPLRPGYNGDLRTKSAGKIGGVMGGLMVKELVRIAQEQLAGSGRR